MLISAYNVRLQTGSFLSLNVLLRLISQVPSMKSQAEVCVPLQAETRCEVLQPAT